MTQGLTNAGNTTESSTSSSANTDVATGHDLLGRVFDAVLFDMDGTLVDSTRAVNRAWLRWGAEAGLGPSFGGAEHGVPARQMVARLVPEDKIEWSIARVLELELDDLDGIEILPGAAELMQSLPDSRRAIVTSCARSLCLARLDSAGFPVPSTVVTIDDTPRGKPFPEPFLEAAARLGVDPRRCVVVEDAPAGLEAGRAAGCLTIGVAGTHTVEQLDADLVVPSLDRLRISVRDTGIVFELLPE